MSQPPALTTSEMDRIIRANRDRAVEAKLSYTEPVYPFGNMVDFQMGVCEQRKMIYGNFSMARPLPRRCAKCEQVMSDGRLVACSEPGCGRVFHYACKKRIRQWCRVDRGEHEWVCDQHRDHCKLCAAQICSTHREPGLHQCVPDTRARSLHNYVCAALVEEAQVVREALDRYLCSDVVNLILSIVCEVLPSDTVDTVTLAPRLFDLPIDTVFRDIASYQKGIDWSQHTLFKSSVGQGVDDVMSCDIGLAMGYKRLLVISYRGISITICKHTHEQDNGMMRVGGHDSKMAARSYHGHYYKFACGGVEFGYHSELSYEEVWHLLCRCVEDAPEKQKEFTGLRTIPRAVQWALQFFVEEEHRFNLFLTMRRMALRDERARDIRGRSANIPIQPEAAQEGFSLPRVLLR